MVDMEMVVEGLRNVAEELARYAPMKVNGRCHGCIDVAIHLLKEQDALLNKIYNELSEWGLDSACDDLVCDDGWCDEHCDTTGTKPECIERWFKYLLKKDGEVE